MVVVGASWIGCETAAGLRMKYKDLPISLVCSDSVPFERHLGKEIGAMMANEHKNNNVKVHTKARVKAIHPDSEGKVNAVSLTDGTILYADLVVMGTGVTPATEFLKGSGIDIDEDGGVVCDPFLNTNWPNIFAAGDIASYPYWPTGDRTRTEHWVVALD